MPPPVTRLRDAFARRFGGAATVVARAPGRVNLIGDHTDYNEGWVLPIALEQATWVAAAPRDDGVVRAVSLSLPAEAQWSLTEWDESGQGHWTAYLAGVIAQLARRGGRFGGLNLLIESDVPVGGGLASSAAFELATALAAAHLSGLDLGPIALADLCRAAEHEHARVPCGIMDQYVSALARAGCALFLDCRTRQYEHVPLPPGPVAIVIVDSGVRHELAAGEYQARQDECRRAVAVFTRQNPRISTLRDVDMEGVAAAAARLSSPLDARARHVVSENERTKAAVAALRAADWQEFGRLMRLSHVSLRDDFAVSCEALDRLVDILEGVPGVLGARMTGGGFGGCVVAVARSDAMDSVRTAIRERYDSAGFGPARIMRTTAGTGASVEFPRE